MTSDTEPDVPSKGTGPSEERRDPEPRPEPSEEPSHEGPDPERRPDRDEP